MTEWPSPEYSRTEVNRAGEVLKKMEEPWEEISTAFAVLNNWRACHGYPINTFQALLRLRTKEVQKTGIVAQRLKRIPSIISKLHRFDKMQLSRMQDIGGLRAVVNTLRTMRRLERRIQNARFEHELVNHKDYIENPKHSGYRSVHLVYRYKNWRAPNYEGLLIELQFRTKIQHAWATAVETMGTFLKEALKASEGPEEWLDFFTLTGSAFAHVEKTQLVPGYENLSKSATIRRVKAEARRLNVQSRLQGYSLAAQQIVRDPSRGSLHLIELDLEQRQVTLTSFAAENLEEASAAYLEVEKRAQGGANLQAVLVSTNSIRNLRQAYPNYFLDTQDFLRLLREL